MQSIEIERKFLLKSLPTIKSKEKIEIQQWYRKNSKGIWERARACYSDKKGFYFIHTIKTNISNISNMEDENVMTSSEFNKFVIKCKKSKESRYISKDRIIYTHTDDGLKWEVDVFNNGHHLIVAEIEIPTEDYNLNIPLFIQDKILLEVTGLKQFSNRNLSNVWKR
jgi:CYTH domain-containing protein